MSREMSLSGVPGLSANATELVRILRQPEGDIVYVVRGAHDATPADPGAWGLMAADLLHHVADIMVKEGVRSADGLLTRGAILDRMRTLLDSEWADRAADARKHTDA